MALPRAAVATAACLLVISLCWMEGARAQITNVNRPECNGVFDFYFVLDRYMYSYVNVTVSCGKLVDRTRVAGVFAA